MEVFTILKGKPKIEKVRGGTWHMRSYNNIERGCKFDGRPGGLINMENNFGEYGCNDIDQDHCCSSLTASVIQHWFGAKYDL